MKMTLLCSPPHISSFLYDIVITSYCIAMPLSFISLFLLFLIFYIYCAHFVVFIDMSLRNKLWNFDVRNQSVSRGVKRLVLVSPGTLISGLTPVKYLTVVENKAALNQTKKHYNSSAVFFFRKDSKWLDF